MGSSTKAIKECVVKTLSRTKLWLFVSAIFVTATLCWKLDPIINRRTVQKRDDETKRIIQQLASEVEALSRKTGIVPTNREHLIQLLGKPLPRSGWNTPINYKYVVTNGNFRIESLSPYPHWMIFEYNSCNPTSGVASYSF